MRCCENSARPYKADPSRQDVRTTKKDMQEAWVKAATSRLNARKGMRSRDGMHP